MCGLHTGLFHNLLFSERLNERRRGAAGHVEMDQFRLLSQETVSGESVNVRPGIRSVLRDYNT